MWLVLRCGAGCSAKSAAGLELVSVWLNEDGLPRDPHIRTRILTAPDRLLAGTPLRSTRTSERIPAGD